MITSGNILLVGSILLFASIAVSKTSARFGVPTLLLFLFVGMLFGSDGLGIQFNDMKDAQFVGMIALYPIFMLAVVFFTFSVCDLFKGNGYLAVYISGMMIGNSKIANRKEISTFFDGLTWLFQIIMFILLGLLVNPREMLDVVLVAILVAAFMILIGRPLSVAISLLPFRKITARSKLYISWVGLRGAEFLVPNGSLHLQAGDKLLLISEGAKKR